MTFYDVYVGDLDDPTFSWDGGDWWGNAPTRLSPFLPRAGQVEPFFSLLRLIDEHALDGKQTDWGCWVARVTKQQILELLETWYGGVDRWISSQPPVLAHVAEEMRDLRAWVEQLDDNKLYALAATEL